MNELSDTKLKRPMDPALRGADIAVVNEMLNLLNNPEITGAVVPPGVDVRAHQTAIPREFVLPSPHPTSTAAAAALEMESHIEAPALGYPLAAQVAARSAKIFFTGKLRAGKDHAAKAVGAHIFGFADPIYEIASNLTGLEINSTHGKELPGVRALLQAIGQWGRNEVNAQYPLTPARILFVKMVRETTAFKLFGIDKDIWIEDILRRWSEWSIGNQNARAAITNVRFANEYKALSTAGWTHWHVMCSPATWASRLAAAKLTPQSPAVLDMSEALAAKLDGDVIKQISANKTGPMLRCIWNDDTVKPPSNRLHTLNSFLQTLAISEVPADVADDSNILTGE